MQFKNANFLIKRRNALREVPTTDGRQSTLIFISIKINERKMVELTNLKKYFINVSIGNLEEGESIKKFYRDGSYFGIFRKVWPAQFNPAQDVANEFKNIFWTFEKINQAVDVNKISEYFYSKLLTKFILIENQFKEITYRSLKVDYHN